MCVCVCACAVAGTSPSPVTCTAESPCTFTSLKCVLVDSTAHCDCTGIEGQLGKLDASAQPANITITSLILRGNSISGVGPDWYTGSSVPLQTVDLADNLLRTLGPNALPCNSTSLAAGARVTVSGNPIAYLHPHSCFACGTVEQDAASLICPAFTVLTTVQIAGQNETEMAACYCQPGVSCLGDTVKVCKAGTANRYPYESNCTSCAAGRYARYHNSMTCESCAEGFYSASPGATECEACVDTH